MIIYQARAFWVRGGTMDAAHAGSEPMKNTLSVIYSMLEQPINNNQKQPIRSLKFQHNIIYPGIFHRLSSCKEPYCRKGVITSKVVNICSRLWPSPSPPTSPWSMTRPRAFVSSTVCLFCSIFDHFFDIYRIFLFPPKTNLVGMTFSSFLERELDPGPGRGGGSGGQSYGLQF